MDYRARIESILELTLQLPHSGSTRLLNAMRYCVLGGGKRLRPSLVYAAGTALGAPLEAMDDAATAVELIHVYSLVHDDLPAMDNDDLRRGRATCHKAFDEATAILAGDALQALAFEVLSGPTTITKEHAVERLHMMKLLAHGIGTQGMAGGQAVDLEAVGHSLDLNALKKIHRCKTGALIKCSVLMGASAAGVLAGTHYEALGEYGEAVGLAFQIQDDILDVQGTTANIGKIAGADAARSKPTYPSVIGLAAAQAAAKAQRDRALEAIAPLGNAGTALADLANYTVNRTN